MRHHERDLPEQFVASVKAQLGCLKVGGSEFVSFPPALASAERRYIHKLSEQLGFHSQSTGDGADRCIKVFLDADNSIVLDSEDPPARKERGEKLSRMLSYVLRHRAEKLGLSLSSDGFASVAEILQLPSFRQASSTEEEVLTMVRTCKKQRFAWKYAAGKVWVRANQGHTISAISDLALLSPVEDPGDLRVCIHGTYFVHWGPICRKGLQDMGRNHIHLVAREPGQEVMSGMRSDVQIAIYVDAARAMADGCKFFRSANDVVLTRGFGGLLPAEYFLRAVVLAGDAEHEAGSELPLSGVRDQPSADAVPPPRFVLEAAAASGGGSSSAESRGCAARPSELAGESADSSDEEVLMGDAHMGPSGYDGA